MWREVREVCVERGEGGVGVCVERGEGAVGVWRGKDVGVCREGRVREL